MAGRRFSVRPAEGAEAERVRAWLPDAFPAIGRAPELFVATGAGYVVGAAAVAWVPGGFPVLLHVQPEFRRAGVGRALMEAAAASACGETGALRTWANVAEGSAGQLFLRAAGFQPVQRFLMFETDGAAFAAAMARLLERVARHVPASARLAALGDAPPDGVVRLVARGFAALPHNVAVRLIPGARNGYDAEHSLVLMRGGEVAGAMLCRVDEGTLQVEVNVLDPALRGGWANLMLLEAMARRGRAAGFPRFRFGCEPHVRDTVGLARRCGAASLPDQWAMARGLVDGRGAGV